MDTTTLCNSNKDEIKKDQENAQNGLSQPEKYSLCGYLLKHSDKVFARGLIPHGTAGKNRWFIYSDSTCKLYYYKSEKDPEPLGEIDIALSSLTYNVDSRNSGLFTISSHGKDHILEASSPQKRLYWLQNLQNARREFSDRLNMVNFRSGGCVELPDSGLLQDSKPLPEPASDPHHDLIANMNKSIDSFKNQDKETVSKLSRCSLNLPLKKLPFRTSSSSSPKQDGQSLHCMNSDSEATTPRSPITSPLEVNHHFDKLSRKLRSSLRLRKSKPAKLSTEMEVSEEECIKCAQFQEDLDIMNKEATKLSDKCDAYKEAVNLLQKDLELTQKEKLTLEKLISQSVTDENILAIFGEKDRKIVELENSQHKLKNTISSLTSSLRDSRIRGEHLQEKISMLTMLLESKDNAIVDLSHKLGERSFLVDGQGENSSSSSTFYRTSMLESCSHNARITIGTQTTSLEYNDLKDQLEAYKCQNTFLNKEILEHNLILKRRNERESKLINESSNWEAKFYQIQSKYLLLLNDLHSPQSNQHDSSVLSQLLHDVVDAQGTTDLRIVSRQGKGYNEFGFCVSAPPNGSDLLSKAEFLQKQSKENAWRAELQKKSNCSAQWESQWESFLAGTNAKELPQHPELKYLIREGIPYQYKGKVWRLLIESCIGKYKATLSPSYYQDLLSRRYSTSTLDPSSKQIELDLLRTLPNNRHYESPYSDGIPKLRRVLLAYSRRNLSVGYCQGLNRLGAIALLFLNEEDAFWCLVYMIEFLMPSDFYTRNLLGSQVDQRVLKDLISEKLPRLSSHFDQHELDISLFTFNWFLCIYVDAIPPSTYLYIWDSFLYEGSKVLFRFAIAIFKVCEEELLSKKDYMSMFDYLRSVPDQVADLQKLKQVAFQWTNPLSMKYIRNKREYHKAIVQAELEEVEKVRESYHLTKKESDEEKSEREEKGEEDEVFLEDTELMEEVTENGRCDGLGTKGMAANNGQKEPASAYSEVKAKFRELKSNGKMLLNIDVDKEKNEKYTSVRLVPKTEISDEDTDDEQFEVITVRRESPSDTDGDHFIA